MNSEGRFGRLKPRKDFDLRKGGPGAWQAGVRYSRLDLNDSDIQGGELDNVTLGINWHWSSNIRLMFNYVMVDLDRIFDGRSTDADATYTMLRFQMAF